MSEMAWFRQSTKECIAQQWEGNDGMYATVLNIPSIYKR